MTAEEIAKLANVSRATVYRVVNNKPNVNQKTKALVRRVIDQYDYKPNVAGKALVKRRYQAKIGVIIPAIKNDFYKQVKNGLDSALDENKDMGFDVIYREMIDFSIDEQLASINDMKDAGVDALCLVAIDHDEIRKALNALESTPIITFISDISDVNKLCFVGNNLEQSGRVAYDLISKLLNGVGNVAIITTALNLSAHKKRLRGFKNKLNECHDAIKIIEIAENHDDDQSSFDIIKALFLSKIKVDAVYSTTGLGIDGLGRGLETYDQKGNTKVVVSDKIAATKALLKKSVIDFTICQDPFQEGYMPLKLLFDYLIKSEVPKQKEFYTNTDIRVWENI
jgi:LacI family transcriptional regulator